MTTIDNPFKVTEGEFILGMNSTDEDTLSLELKNNEWKVYARITENKDETIEDYKLEINKILDKNFLDQWDDFNSQWELDKLELMMQTISDINPDFDFKMEFNNNDIIDLIINQIKN